MRRALAIFFRQVAEDARTALAKDRSQVRKVVEGVLNEIDRAAAFGDPNRAAAFEEKHLRDVPKFKSRADLVAQALNLKEAKIPDGVYLEFGVYRGRVY
jgi:pantothenate synthetase